MSNRNNRRPFDIGKKFVAAKSFTFNGRRYGKGDDFPWRRIACARRKLLQLYEGRYINTSAEYDEEAEKERKAEARKAAKAREQTKAKKKSTGGGGPKKQTKAAKKPKSKKPSAEEQDTLPPEELPTEPPKDGGEALDL